MSRLMGTALRPGSMALRSLQVRWRAAVPATGRTPPTLDEFDPLNPGEWQLGAGGRILPRLPEGTRVGKLVMGEYGLYCPRVKKFQEYCRPFFEAGEKTYNIRPWQRRLSKYIYPFAHAVLAFGFLLIFTVFNEKPFWPFEGFFRLCGVKWEGMDRDNPAAN